MEIITKISEMQTLSKKIHLEGKNISLVPTMGYLHEGHLNLIKKAKNLADIVVTSLFVNPTQFAPNEDFDSYPRDFDRDMKLASEAGSDFLFYPNKNEMYPKNYNTMVGMSGVVKKFEGITRPNHFSGVATIVSKLFNAVNPEYAIFGQKDYQQTLVIKQLVRDLNFGVKIVIAPTTREIDGLAMSSRNVYLNSDERIQATILYRTINEAANLIENGEIRRKIINGFMHNILRQSANIRIDYASAADAETLDEPENFLPDQRIVLLIAVYIGKIRLIDNMIITAPGVDGISKPLNFIEDVF